MRKKLDTRFPAARIKKIMQADDEVGKIAMATPVLISKALELFLQDLCDRTYDITLKRGAKTMNSHHLKECVHSHSVFDFLRESVSRIPDLDPESAAGESGRRRKAVDCDNDESGDEETKRPKSCEGPAKGRSRRGKKRRNSNGQTMESSEPMMDKPDDNGATSSSPQLSDDCHGNSSSSPKARLQQHADDASSYLVQTSRAAAMDSAGNGHFPKDFDLNMGLDENGEVNDAKPNSMPEPEAEAEPEPELEVGNQSPWSGPDPSSFLYHGHNAFQLAEEEEDYDCEDEEV